MIEFTRDGLHRRRVELLRLEHHGKRVAGEFRFREDIEREKAAFHAALIMATVRTPAQD
jgi:hypothetical protein